MLGKDALRLNSQLITNKHENREWSEDFIDAKMTVLQKNPKATKCSNHHTISLTAHTAKMVGGYLEECLEKTGNNWHNKTDQQIVKYNWTNRKDTRSVKTKRGLRQGTVCHQFYSTLHSKYFTKETLQRFEDFKIGGQVIHAVQYADTLAKEERVLQDIPNTLTELEDAMERK